MLGYDMSWASFHVLEVMSSPKYHQKRVGYLGAVQSFRPDTEVLMLATNLLKKVSQGTLSRHCCFRNSTAGRTDACVNYRILHRLLLRSYFFQSLRFRMSSRLLWRFLL